jgi:uncharacterized protein YdhG (YjbR/CyaY superfamily)
MLWLASMVFLKIKKNGVWMQSEAKTVEEYINALPEERQQAIRKVRKLILENLPEGYEEVMNWGMITYQVPLSVYPDTYNKKPLMFAALASQKNHMAVYLSTIYINEDKRVQFEESYRETGKRYDVGKSCVRFRKLDDLPLSLIGKEIASFSVNDFIEIAKNSVSTRKKK